MSYKEQLEIANKNMANLFKKCPSIAKSFGELHDEALENKEISTKNKELIALGIAIAIRCEDCIVCHVDAAQKAGATLNEIYETVEVAIMMGGGPAIAYGSKAIAAAEEYKKI